MTGAPRSVVVERHLPHPPEKVWRALTLPHLMEEWLMRNDFRPEVGHRFSLTADWGRVECEVIAVEPHQALAYSWGDANLQSTVSWTLTATEGGTLLRMEQTGFGNEPPRYYFGASQNWPRFIDALEDILKDME